MSALPSCVLRPSPTALQRRARLAAGMVAICLWSLRMSAAWAGSPVTDTEVKPFQALPRPGYLEPRVDPVFGTTITRITGDPGTPILHVDGVWDQVARHHYSKDAAWNCDQSLLYLERHGGHPGHLFLDGTTYEPLFGRTCPGAEARWHPRAANEMVFVRDDLLGLWDVRADTTRVLARFPGYADLRIGPGEGNLSRDGRWIVLQGRKGEQSVAFAYDLERKEKHTDLVLTDVDIDWVSISAGGNYIVLNGRVDAEGHGDQTQVFDLEGGRIGAPWLEYGRPSHYDLTIDDDGEEVAVGVSKSDPDNGRVIKRRLRDGRVTVLTTGGYASHTSARNVLRPGWVYVSYSHRGPSWPPYFDEVVAVKLDGSEVERIAHMHALRVDYLSEAHAVPAPDGMRVLFASDWDAESGRPLGAYVVDLLPRKTGVVTAVVASPGDRVPASFALSQNYPNPFNPETLIRFDLPTAGAMELTVYNLALQKVATLVQGPHRAGSYSVRWDGRDSAGRRLATGVYLCRLRAGTHVRTRKLLLLH